MRLRECENQIMKKITLTTLFITLLSVCLLQASTRWDVPREHLTYDVMYKWGLINKKAGSVSLDTHPHAEKKEFNAVLTGATAPWADHFFMLRDTLMGTINATNFFPEYYEKIAHEGGAYDRDLLYYSRSGDKVTAEATLWRRRKKEKVVTRSQQIHEAEGITLDMLSSFYYMRQLPFPTMKHGESVRMNIFSGKKKEILTIHFKGIENVKIGKTEYPSYHITFTFTTEGGAVSSDNMDAWISTAPNRIPLLMEGKLPVGKVRAVYSGPITS